MGAVAPSPHSRDLHGWGPGGGSGPALPLQRAAGCAAELQPSLSLTEKLKSMIKNMKKIYIFGTGGV